MLIKQSCIQNISWCRWLSGLRWWLIWQTVLSVSKETSEESVVVLPFPITHQDPNSLHISGCTHSNIWRKTALHRALLSPRALLKQQLCFHFVTPVWCWWHTGTSPSTQHSTASPGSAGSRTPPWEGFLFPPPVQALKHVHTLLLPNDVLFPATSSWQTCSPNPHEMQTVPL